MINNKSKQKISLLDFEGEGECPNCKEVSKNNLTLYKDKFNGKIIDKKVICKSCGLIYKSPKMTLKSSNFFYDKIYLEYMFGNEKVNPEERHYLMGKGRESELKMFSKEIIGSKYPPLEIGCSSGGVLSILSKINKSSQGIDIDSNAIKFARMKGLNAKEFNLFKLKSESRDFILMSHTLEHLGDISRMLRKISQVLVKGGKLLVFVPDSYQMLEPPHIPHDFCFSRETLKSLLSKHEFKEIKFIPTNERPRGFKKDLIVMFEKDPLVKPFNSKYKQINFLKYKYYLVIYSILNPILLRTKTKAIIRKILNR